MTKLEELKAAADVLIDGVTADIWYDAALFNDASAQKRIDATQDAMSLVFEQMPQLLKAMRFVELVSRMTTDEEMDGDMSGDDACSAISGLIEEARGIAE